MQMPSAMLCSVGLFDVAALSISRHPLTPPPPPCVQLCHPHGFRPMNAFCDMALAVKPPFCNFKPILPRSVSNYQCMCHPLQLQACLHPGLELLGPESRVLFLNSMLVRERCAQRSLECYA